MRNSFSSSLGKKLRLVSWPTALIAIVVIKAVLSLAVRPGSLLVSYSGISYFLPLLLATGLAIRNGIQDTLDSRPFWVLLAIAYGLWLLHYNCRALRRRFILRLATPALAVISERQGKAEASA